MKAEQLEILKESRKSSGIGIDRLRDQNVRVPTDNSADQPA